MNKFYTSAAFCGKIPNRGCDKVRPMAENQAAGMAAKTRKNRMGEIEDGRE